MKGLCSAPFLHGLNEKETKMELLKVENLSVEIGRQKDKVKPVRDVSFSLHKGEVLAIVGESGCGKSMLCKSVIGLLPKSGKITAGSIYVAGTDITHYTERQMEKLRGSFFSMIFQDPLTALDPTYTIGSQIAEAIRVHHKDMTKAEVNARVLELMHLVGIEEPQERKNLYPYNFSGGMRQRSVMAIALASNPKVLLADEPTTALDVTIQAQILDLLRMIQQELDTATILVSHDLGVVARVADRVAIMYAGKIVEIGTAKEIQGDRIVCIRFQACRRHWCICPKAMHLRPEMNMHLALIMSRNRRCFRLRRHIMRRHGFWIRGLQRLNVQ